MSQQASGEPRLFALFSVNHEGGGHVTEELGFSSGIGLGSTSSVEFSSKTGMKKVPIPPNGSISTFPDCTAVDGNLVTNCGFETGDFSGWTLSGDTSFTSVNTAAAHSGNFGASLGPVNHLGLMSQSLVATGSCTISFWLANLGRPSQFEVWFGGDRLSQITTVPDLVYTQFTFTNVPVGTGDLTFAFSNRPAFIFLDDVVVLCS